MITLKRYLTPLLICLLAFVCVAVAKPKVLKPIHPERTYGDAIVGQVVSVTDAATFTVNIKDYPPLAGDRIQVRIYGIDTPDLQDNRKDLRRLAIRARLATMAELRTAKTIRLQNMRRDKSFRILADVDLDGRSLAKILLDGGYAKPWFGESRPRWENPPVRP